MKSNGKVLLSRKKSPSFQKVPDIYTGQQSYDAVVYVLFYLVHTKTL